MYVTLKLDQFDITNIFTSEKTKNNIMNHSDFFRLYFSNNEMVMNGVYLNFDLKNVTIDKYFNKIKCQFEKTNTNNQNISSIKAIEKMILNKFNNIRNKTLTSRIKEQLKNGYIKLYGDDKISYGKHKNINFLLKISGIWVSNQTNEFGLTFRFFIFNNHI